MVVRCWLLVVGRSLLVVGCWLLVVVAWCGVWFVGFCCLLIVDGLFHLLFMVCRCVVLVVVFVVGCCSLFVVWCLVFGACWSFVYCLLLYVGSCSLLRVVCCWFRYCVFGVFDLVCCLLFVV